MAGFRFRLEAVQRLRKQAMDTCRRDVAIAIRALQEMDEVIADVTAHLEQSTEVQRQSRRVGKIDPQALSTQQLHRGFLQRRLKELGVEREQCVARLETQRAKLEEATKNLKVIEKLREKQWNKYQIDLRRREQSVSDEMAVQRHLRSSKTAKTVSDMRRAAIVPASERE